MPYILAKDVESDTFWRVLVRLADRMTPALAREVESILRDVGAEMTFAEMQALLAQGNTASVVAQLQQLWDDAGAAPLQARIAPRLEQLAVDVAIRTPVLATEGVQLSLFEQARITEVVGARIVEISATTREAIQGILTRAWDSGRTIQEQAREIRGLIGLTSQQAVSVANYRAGLVQAGESPSRITRLVEERIATVRRQRALNIARTETLQAANLGQQSAWREADTQGFLATGFRRFWLTAQDEATCQICAPIPGMNEGGVGMEQAFKTPVGPVHIPPIHPSCRCTAIGGFID